MGPYAELGESQRRLQEKSAERRELICEETNEPQAREELQEGRKYAVSGPMKFFIHGLNLTLSDSIKFIPSVSENGRELIIDEGSSQKVQGNQEENDLWESPWMQDLKSSSRTPVHTVSEGIPRNVSNTYVSCPDFSWRLDGLISRHNHFEIYSSTLYISASSALDLANMICSQVTVAELKCDLLCRIWRIRV